MLRLLGAPALMMLYFVATGVAAVAGQQRAFPRIEERITMRDHADNLALVIRCSNAIVVVTSAKCLVVGRVGIEPTTQGL